MDWNLVVTIVAGPHRVRDVLRPLNEFGWFMPTAFKDVCVGDVQDVPAFLDRIADRRERGEPWALMIGRIIPVERVFDFIPENFAERLKEAVAPFAERMQSGTCHVRVERRGHAGEIPTQAVERAVADHLYDLAQARGVHLATSFTDPDYVVVAETLGEQCGVALLTRDLARRYPFVQAH